MKIKGFSSICLIILFQLVSANSIAQNVIDLKKLGAYSVEELVAMNIPAQNAVEAYKLIYLTKDINDKETKASGLILIPVIADLANASVAVFNHGATLNRNFVPSNVNFQAEYAGYFASNGYVTLAPDYLGLGDGPGIHPYMHAQSEATASADMIRAVKQAFEVHYQIKLTNDLYITGYSQGGHAAMAFQKYVEEESLTDEFNIKGCAPAAGPYDMRDITFDHVINSIENYGGYDSEVLVCLFASYQEIYGNLYNDLSDYYYPPYDSIINDFFEKDCTTNLNSVIPGEVYKFMRKSVWEDVKKDKKHPILQALTKNNLYNWKPVAPLKMFHSKADKMIPFQNSTFTLNEMRKLGAKNVSVEEVSETLGHNEAMPITMKKVLEWFNSLK
jgi:hypothetical protein